MLFFVPAIFKSLTTDLDSVVMTFGSKVKLHMIFGDITNERTEAVVNTTDFKNFDNGRRRMIQDGCWKKSVVNQSKW